MKKVYQIFIFTIIVTVFCFFSSYSFAGDGLKVGEAELSPYAEITLQYDDNIFLDNNDEKDDFIIILTPGVLVKYPFSDNRLTFDYHASINQYTDHASQDAVNHYFSGDLELNWRDTAINIYDRFSHEFERPSTEDTTRVKHDDNTAGVTAKIKKERLGIQMGYEFFARDYDSGSAYDIYDRDENRYSVILTHETFPKTDLLLEYDFVQVRYDDNTARSDSDYNQILVGAIGELTPKTTATIKTGYQWRDYDQVDNPDFDNAVLYGDVIHAFSDKDSLKLSFERTAEESTYDVNNYYKVEKIAATFDHYFNHKLLGFLTGQYQINSYPRETTEGAETKKRKDEYYSLGAGLRYYLKEWLTLTLRADHIIRGSNFDVYEYNQNLVTFTARAEF